MVQWGSLPLLVFLTCASQGAPTPIMDCMRVLQLLQTPQTSVPHPGPLPIRLFGAPICVPGSASDPVLSRLLPSVGTGRNEAELRTPELGSLVHLVQLGPGLHLDSGL